MAKKIEGITPLDPVEVEVDGETIEIAPGSVQSVTTETPHPADESSAPGPYDGLELNRPPVSTNDPQTPIAHSLVAGAGAPQNTGPHPLVEGPHPDVAYVNDADRKAGNVAEAPDPNADAAKAQAQGKQEGSGSK